MAGWQAPFLRVLASRLSKMGLASRLSKMGLLSRGEFEQQASLWRRLSNMPRVPVAKCGVKGIQ